MHFAHDDVIKWKHFPRYSPSVRGIQWSPVDSPKRASDADLWFFICACTNGRANDRDPGDLKRHWAHYDVIIMRDCDIITLTWTERGIHRVNAWWLSFGRDLRAFLCKKWSNVQKVQNRWISFVCGTLSQHLVSSRPQVITLCGENWELLLWQT